MKTVMIALCLSWIFVAPAVAYYRMTPQDMTDQQLIQQYREMDYEQNKHQRRAGAFHINKPILSLMEEKAARKTFDQKNAIMDEIKRRNLQP